MHLFYQKIHQRTCHFPHFLIKYVLFSYYSKSHFNYTKVSIMINFIKLSTKKTNLFLLLTRQLNTCLQPCTRTNKGACPLVKKEIFIVASLILFFVSSIANSKTITLIHMNDLHANLISHNELVRYENGKVKLEKRGGIARIKTVIDKIRKSHKNSLLLNTGDTYHGGVEATYTHGNAIVEAVNNLGIDVGVPGNWDFGYGPGVARERYADGVPWFMKWRLDISDIKKPNFPNLSANVIYTKPFWNKGDPFLPATIIKNINGIKIGIIGITSDIVPKMHPLLSEGFEFLQGEKAYINLIEKHSTDLKKQGANFIVVMSELGIQKDYYLANNITQNSVNLFFSAHTHELTYQPLKSKSGAQVVEAGSDAYLGQMDITFADKKPIKTHWQIHHITQNITPDKALLKIVKIARKPFTDLKKPIQLPTSFFDYYLKSSITTVIGTTVGQLDRKNALESTFNNAFADALRKKSKAQVALAPGFRFDMPISNREINMEGAPHITGNITIEDIYRFFPVVQKIATGETTAGKLKYQIEKNLSDVFSKNIFKQWGGWVYGISGLDLKIDLSRADGDKIISMKLENSDKKLTDNQKIILAGCTRPGEEDDVLCAYQGFKNRKIITKDDNSPLFNIDLIVESIVSGDFKPTTRQNIKDKSGFGFWPNNPFIQPLEGI